MLKMSRDLPIQKPEGSPNRRRIAIVLAASLVLPSCTSAVVSHKRVDARHIDGIDYYLPRTDLTVTATYRLTCATKTEAAKFEMAELVVAPKLVPDPAEHYVIDPDRMSDFLTSVNPAKFELENKMLKTVSYQPKNEFVGVLSETLKLAAQFASSPLSVAPAPPPLACTPTFKAKSEEEIGKAAAAVEKWQKHLARADERVQRAPSEDNMRAVTHAQDRLTAAKAALAALKAKLFERSVTFVAPIGRNTLHPIAAEAPRECNVPVEEKDLAPLAPLFAAVGLDGPQAAAKRRELTCIVAATDIAPGGGDAPRPGPRGYDGLYYRLGASGSLWMRHSASRFEKRFDDLSIMHLGEVRRVKLRNGVLENRGYNLTFAPNGELRSYEATSSSIAKEAIAAAAAAPQTVYDAEKAARQRRIDEAKQKKEEIEAVAALEALMQDDTVTAPEE